jgi:predicted HicB family RNase H-like nuclease
MEKKRKSPKRIAMNVNEKVHHRIKLLAFRRNITITQYIMEAVFFRMQSEKDE